MAPPMSPGDAPPDNRKVAAPSRPRCLSDPNTVHEPPPGSACRRDGWLLPSSWTGRLERKRENEGAPLPQRAFSPSPATMQLDDMFYDGQAEAGATLVARAPLVDPVESLEKMRQILGRNAGTVV